MSLSRWGRLCHERNSAGADFVVLTFAHLPTGRCVRDAARLLHSLPAFRAVPTADGGWRPVSSSPSQHIIESGDANNAAYLAELAKGLVAGPLPWWRVVHQPGGAWAIVASLWYASSSQWTAVLYDLCRDPTPFPFEATTPDVCSNFVFHMAPFLCTFALIASLWLIVTAHCLPHPHGWICVGVAYVALIAFQLWPISQELVRLCTARMPSSQLQAANDQYITVDIPGDRGQLRKLMASLDGPLRITVDHNHGIDPRADRERGFADMAAHSRLRQDCIWDGSSPASIRESSALAASSVLTVGERAGLSAGEPPWATYLTALTCPAMVFDGMGAYVTMPQGRGAACVLNCSGRRRISLCGSSSAVGDLRAQLRSVVCD